VTLAANDEGRTLDGSRSRPADPDIAAARPLSRGFLEW